jgi:PAS domain S-box-containing protein
MRRQADEEDGMTALSIQALVTVLLGSGAFVYVAHRGGRSQLRPSLLAVLGFLVIWMGGKLVVELAVSDAVGRAGVFISYLGVCGLGPSWLVLAARFTRSQLIEHQPMLLAAAGVPAGLAYLALLTNDGHRLFGDLLVLETARQGPLAWGGPIFWAALAWQLMLVLTGVVMFARYASRSMSGARRRHAQLIAVSGFVPVAATVASSLELFPAGVDPVPAIAGLSVAAIIGIAVRYRLLDFLLLARRDVIDALADSVILTDADGMVLDINPAARGLLGAQTRIPRDQPLARILARLTPESEMETIERSIDEALQSGESMTVPLRTRTERELDVSVGSVCDREGEPSARYAVVRDLTEPRRFERLLRESQQRVVVGGLAAGLAHEVNNPLAFVASNLRQIHRVVEFGDGELSTLEEKRSQELAELAEVVAETIDGVERIAEIIGRIIRPATLSEEEIVRLDLGRVVQDAVRLTDFHGQRPIRTDVEPMEQLPHVDGCPERLSQALLNLLINAQTAARSCAEASLFVDAVPDGQGVAVRLGVRAPDGSPWPDSLPPIAPSCSTAEAELSAAYETVREHGGTLETGGEGGMLFVMRLPAAA